MILVTGATGHLGKATIDSLLKKGISANTISALIRDETKATALRETGVKLIKGDFNDYKSLLSAFKGIKTLFLISSSDINNRQQQHENIINAAKEAQIGRIVFTSVTRRREDGSSAIGFLTSSLLSTEKMIKEGGFVYTLLRNPLYADVLPIFLGDRVLSTGVFLPAGDGRASFTSRQDLAEASAEVLAGSGHDGKEYTLANEVNYSFKDIADILTGLSGKPIAYTNPTKEVFTQALVQAGITSEQIGGLTTFIEAIKQGEFETNRTDLPFLLGRRPVSLESFLESVYFKK
jgi:NAD(P)H dehydrogenase (quinone)